MSKNRRAVSLPQRDRGTADAASAVDEVSQTNATFKKARARALAFSLRQFIRQPQIIGDHGDKLAVRRLSAIVLNGVTEIGIERFDVTSVPSDLDRVTDGTLNT